MKHHSPSYDDFLEGKAIRSKSFGMEKPGRLPASLKPFQAAIVRWALRKGRAALFEGTGLGKTLQQLSWADAVAKREKSQILLLTPLAVAQQTVQEAAKFGVSGVAYAQDGASAKGRIVVTNYERFDRFKMGDFAGIVLDESGIIKSQDGSTRAELTDACSDVPWRLCCTATPAPNDYAELGQHAEFLGVMTAKEMLAMFFVHDGSIRANDDSAGSDGWRLKRHAERDFWRWLASWAVAIRHPADLGFDAPEYDLPPLHMHETIVRAEMKPMAGQLFPFMASTLGERIGVRRDTAGDRIKAAAEIVAKKPDEPWLVWCNLNSEADGIEAAIPTALQVAGRHDPSLKVERLLGFKEGKPPILVSKPSLAGHGMNWQHCAHMVFVGLTDSFEQVYQAIRRCYRFGQTRDVYVHFVTSELEGNVLANIRRKEAAFNMMLERMAEHMRDLMKEEVSGRAAKNPYNPKIKMEIPAWLK